MKVKELVELLKEKDENMSVNLEQIYYPGFLNGRILLEEFSNYAGKTNLCLRIEDNYKGKFRRLTKLNLQFLAENDWVFKYKANWSDIYEKVVGNKRWELWFDDSGKTDLEIFYFNRDISKHDPYYHPTSYCIFKGKCYTINDFIFICELLKVE